MSKRLKSYYLNNFEMKEKGKATFQSYIENDSWEEEVEDEEVEKSASAFFDNLLEPRKLQGEEIIAEADKVLKFSEGNKGVSGHLFVTNFKISFVMADKSSYPDGDDTSSSQRSKLLSNTDIPLTCVDAIYQVSSGNQRRKVPPRSTISQTTEHLEIVCKDFQVHVFGFIFTGKNQIKKVTDAISVHAFPEREDLLFAYEFGQNRHFEEDPEPAGFYEIEHWKKELERLHCQCMWRVSDVNLGFKMSTSLPEYFVSPIHILNADLDKVSTQYINKRLPTWSYTYVNGASLLRMSQLDAKSHFKACEDSIMLAIRQSSGNDKDPFILDLAMHCPSLMDLRSSGERLRKMITESARDFYRSDSRWLSSLESSQWLRHVSQCLNAANLVIGQLTRDSQTVVLKEETGCDLVCVISSLVQLQLDPDCRTLQGFQNLMHREWVLMGHPFQKRLGLLHHSGASSPDAERVPVFLLFLDCVWQLLQQFPSSFAFSETYLTTLWDTAHVGIFDNFLFDSCWQRQAFLRETIRHNKQQPMSLPSAWDWPFQMNEEHLLLFNNPLYLLRTSGALDSSVHSAQSDHQLSEEILRDQQYPTCLSLGEEPYHTDLFSGLETVLKPVTTASVLKLWSQCYLRWLVPAQIMGGGQPTQYLQQCVLAEEVLSLQHRLQNLTEKQSEAQYTQIKRPTNSLVADSRSKSERPHSGLVFGPNLSKQLSSLYITSSFPFSPIRSDQTQHTLIAHLSKYLRETVIDHDYGLDEED